MCSQVIAKIIKKEIGKYIAVAESIEYNFYSANHYKVGDCVIANVLSYDDNEGLDDENEFYLEDANQPLSNIKEWTKQEENC